MASQEKGGEKTVERREMGKKNISQYQHKISHKTARQKASPQIITKPFIHPFLH
jgi:hypothetical protein